MNKHLLAAVCFSTTTAVTACTPEQLALFLGAISNPGDDHSGEPPPASDAPWVSTEQDVYASTFNGLTLSASVDERRAYILGATRPSYSARTYRVDAVDVTGPALSRHAQTAIGALEGGSYPLAVFAPRAGAEIDEPLAARVTSPNSLLDNDPFDPLVLNLEPVSGVDGDIPNDLLQIDDPDALPAVNAGVGSPGLFDVVGNRLVHTRMDWDTGSLRIEYRELNAEGLSAPGWTRALTGEPDTAYGWPAVAHDESLGGIVVRYIQRHPEYADFIEFASIGSGERVLLPLTCPNDVVTFKVARAQIASDRGSEFVVAETCPDLADSSRSDVRLFAVSTAEALSVREVASFGIDHGTPDTLREVSLAATPDHVLVSAFYGGSAGDDGRALSSRNDILRVEDDGSVTHEHTLVLNAREGGGTCAAVGMLPEALSNGTDFFVFTVTTEREIRTPDDLIDPSTGERVAPESRAVLRRIRPN